MKGKKINRHFKIRSGDGGLWMKGKK